MAENERVDPKVLAERIVEDYLYDENVRILARRVLELQASLEELRMWLVEDLRKAGGLDAVADDPVDTCLTVARGRILALEQQLAEARKLLGVLNSANRGDYLTPAFISYLGRVSAFLESK